MDFKLSEEQRVLRDTVRSFMKGSTVRELIRKAEDDKKFPVDFMKLAASMDLLGMNIRGGLNYLDAVMAVEEIAYWSIPLSLGILVQNSLGGFAVSQFGSERQKRIYLDKIDSGEIFVCFANTEPDVGSDAKNIRTKAVKDDDKWMLNGTKRFITNASVSSLAIVSARTSPRRAGHPGITTFLIDIGPRTRGYKLEKKETKDIQPGSELCEFSLNNYVARDDNILGRIDGGWKVVDRTFQHSRVWIAAQGVGAAQRALDETIKYTGGERKTFGKLILDNQYIGFELAKLQVEIESSRLLTYKAACQEMDNSKEFAVTSSMAKFAAAEVAKKASSLCYQYFGGMSASKESISYKLHRDIPIIAIYEGPSEIQLQILWKNIQRMVKQIESTLT